ncbi:PREDICTED: trihelix transcription factor GTL1-like [Trachymyrmex cornetzi]|nr:PREDICTED: trihelix transcription factor GTL1-like [Trachymyrmex cornetzi]
MIKMFVVNNELREIVQIGDKYFYKKNDDTYESIQLSEGENKRNFVEQREDEVQKHEKKIWTNESILRLINLVEEFEEQFQNSIKKHIWMKISKILTTDLGTSITWQQCDTKWKGLLKIYKDIKEHNSSSGRNRKRWEYFEVMNEMLHNKPEITPVATCSNTKGLMVNEESSGTGKSTEDEENITDDKYSCDNKRKSSSTCATDFFKKKRSSIGNAVERRHQEKMQRQDDFLKCFNEYVGILRDKKNSNDE